MSRLKYVLILMLLLGIVGVYSNHFGNSFHFDDAHTIESNVHIRSLANVPRFFRDPATFSNLPTHQVYRPLLTSSLALDYVRGGGRPYAFHVTNIVFFLVLVWAAWLLYSCALSGNWVVALLAVSVYALHPVISETLNYIIQRGDLISTLGVVLGLLLYIRLPRWRRYGLYLLPVIAGLLVKPPALIFPVLLFLWVFLYQESGNWGRSARAVLPSVLVCAAMGWFLAAMTAGTFNPGGTSPFLYRVTQMYVSLYYFSAFFAPFHLTADTDWSVLPGLQDQRAWAGALFLVCILLAIRLAAAHRDGKPVAFGLGWFLAALFPTAWMPLAEVANDHRMFFPFIGLSLAVVQTMYLLTFRWHARSGFRYAAVCAVFLVLALEARGTWLRNEVWRTEETLWRDTIAKSPKNGRALMNYALTLMGRGAFHQAVPYLERAHQIQPNYFILEINLAVACSRTNRLVEAENHFRRAQQLEPRRYESHFFYGKWLNEVGRQQEALAQIRSAVVCNPYALDAHHLLLQLLAGQRDWTALQTAVEGTLEAVPGDSVALRYKAMAAEGSQSLETMAERVRQQPSPENWLTYSLLLYQSGKYQECIVAAQTALRLRSGYAEAWNNIAAAYNAMQEWNAGIDAADKALRLSPGFELARNNRAWAVYQLQQRQNLAKP